MKVLVSISCGMLNVFSVSYNERSKPINLGESSDGGEKRNIRKPFCKFKAVAVKC